MKSIAAGPLSAGIHWLVVEFGCCCLLFLRLMLEASELRGTHRFLAWRHASRGSSVLSQSISLQNSKCQELLYHMTAFSSLPI